MYAADKSNQCNINIYVSLISYVVESETIEHGVIAKALRRERNICTHVLETRAEVTS